MRVRSTCDLPPSPFGGHLSFRFLCFHKVNAPGGFKRLFCHASLTSDPWRFSSAQCQQWVLGPRPWQGVIRLNSCWLIFCYYSFFSPKSKTKQKHCPNVSENLLKTSRTERCGFRSHWSTGTELSTHQSAQQVETRSPGHSDPQNAVGPVRKHPGS